MRYWYLNNAGTSHPKPPAVHAAVQRALDAPPEDYPALFDEAHASIAAALGVPSPDRMLLTAGGTAALALAIGDLYWSEGDVVITSSLEHHALARPVDKLVRERGVVHHRSTYRPGKPFDLDWLEAMLEAESVRLIAVTHASNVTGEVLPIRAIVELAHAHGCLVLLDAAQTVGLRPVDVAELGVDLFCLAGHKGALGPQGVGLFWAAPHVLFESPRATCDIDGGDEREERPACSPFPSYCDAGSVNLAGALGLAAGLRWLDANSPDGVGALPRRLARELAAELAAMDHVRLLGAADAERTGTVGFVVDGLSLGDAEAYFRGRGLTIRAGSHCAPMALEALGRPDGCLRVSFGPFNAPADRDHVLSACRSRA